jgi:hypothetical protein
MTPSTNTWVDLVIVRQSVAIEPGVLAEPGWAQGTKGTLSPLQLAEELGNVSKSCEVMGSTSPSAKGAPCLWGRRGRRLTARGRLGVIPGTRVSRKHETCARNSRLVFIFVRLLLGASCNGVLQVGVPKGINSHFPAHRAVFPRAFDQVPFQPRPDRA